MQHLHADRALRQGPPDARAPDASDTLFRAYHRAFARELRRAVADLPVEPGAAVLDAPCGDGFHACALARRLHPFGRLTALDRSEANLERARAVLERAGPTGSFEAVAGDVYDLPFDDGRFDLAWCAQSFISLGEPARVLAELRRVVRRGGVVAVLESDEFHHVLLPWPVELELALQRAIHAALRERYGSGTALSPGRSVRRQMLEAGLKPVRKQTYAGDRHHPFSGPVRRFLELHLEFLRGLVEHRLGERHRPTFQRFIDPEAEGSLFRRPDAEVTCLNTVYVGTC
jgi:ubiquinone/menaquinone biosynthesis C-methylase UbiE